VILFDIGNLLLEPDSTSLPGGKELNDCIVVLLMETLRGPGSDASLAMENRPEFASSQLLKPRTRFPWQYPWFVVRPI